MASPDWSNKIEAKKMTKKNERGETEKTGASDEEDAIGRGEDQEANEK